MMRTVRTVLQILILYIFHYLGVLIVTLTKIPLPPSVVGFILLFICLLLKWIKIELIRDGASFLIGFMLLFYIPPMVGIIEYPQLLSYNGLILILGVIVSTLFAILITSFLSQKIEKKEEMWKKQTVEVNNLDEIQEKEVDQPIMEKDELKIHNNIENEDLETELEQKGDKEEEYVESSTINH
ncbi:hypothetical protein MTP04_11220 [Lysinibacillus sp. PLM2]|nr:hypothetical protein MTP04_11220 [Lysinibacillus sp. PLM2]